MNSVIFGLFAMLSVAVVLPSTSWADSQKLVVVVPTEQMWRMTTQKPEDDWMKPDFDVSGWKEGAAPFGTNPPQFTARTPWRTADIWLRRDCLFPVRETKNLQFYLYHDEDVEIYINGVLAAKAAGYTIKYVLLEIAKEAQAQLVPGNTITLAVHCHQTIGQQGIDVGIYDVQE